MIRVQTVTLRKLVPPPDGRRTYGLDSQSFSASDKCSIYEDTEHRKVYVAVGGEVNCVPFENVALIKYFDVADVGLELSGSTELKVVRGEVPGEMTLTLEKRGPGRPRKYPQED